jgi:hypothetical protein
MALNLTVCQGGVEAWLETIIPPSTLGPDDSVSEILSAEGSEMKHPRPAPVPRLKACSGILHRH